MDLSPQEYQQYVKQRAQKSPLVKDVVLAFVIGGLICVLGQLIQNGWAAAGLNQEDAGTATSCSLVLLSALLTGLNLYNKIARHGGAGNAGAGDGICQRRGVPGHRLQERGLCHRHGGEDVHRGGAGHRLRHRGLGAVRRDFEALPTLKLPGFFANKGRPCPAWTAFVHHKPWEPFRLLRWAAKMFSVILSWSASFISRNWQPYSRGPSSFSMTRST